jgi:flagellar biosynthesis/type III secretory pathway chaperone
MDLPLPLQELLRDEAYAFLCREAVEEQLVAMEQQKAALLKTRSPFGVLRRKESIAEIDRSIEQATRTADSLRARMVRLAKYEETLQQRIRADLQAYLKVASAEYQGFGRLQELYDKWHATVHQDFRGELAAFSREMREILQIATAPGARPLDCGPKLRELRTIAVRLESLDTALAKIVENIQWQCHELAEAEDVRAPVLPQVRRVLWVDWLSVIPLDQLVGELTRAETEVRTTLRASIDEAARVERASSERCANLKLSLLETYWSQLRTHAQTYYVEPLDVDSVLKVFADRYDEAGPAVPRQEIHHPRRSLA